MSSSIELVSKETSEVTDRIAAMAVGHLIGKGWSMDQIQERTGRAEKVATANAVKMAVSDWRTNLDPCTADRFVQLQVQMTFMGCFNSK